MEGWHEVTPDRYCYIPDPGTLAFPFIVLALQGWPALIIWVIVILIQLGLVRREERVLAETFGAKYATYRSRTWFLSHRGIARTIGLFKLEH